MSLSNCDALLPSFAFQATADKSAYLPYFLSEYASLENSNPDIRRDSLRSLSQTGDLSAEILMQAGAVSITLLRIKLRTGKSDVDAFTP